MRGVAIDEVVHFDVVTHVPSTGAISDADATPTFDVYEEATDTGLLGATNFTKRTSLTGNYRGTFTASAANGFEAGKWYSVIASATVSSVAGKAVALHFQAVPAESSAGVPKVDVSHVAGTSQTAGDIIGDTNDIQSRLPAALVSGRIDASVGAMAADTITAAAIATGAIDADAIAANAIGASELAADAVAEIADAVWDEDATGHQTGGTFGQAIGDPGADTTTIYQSVVTDAAGTNIAADIIAIEAQTDDIGAAGAGLTAVPWNAAWDAEVQSEVDDALVAQNLDHLVKIAVDTNFATTVHADSVVGQLADNGAGFDRTTDSLEAIRDHATTIKTDTAAILADTGTDGVVIATGAIASTTFSAGAIDASAVAADAITSSELAQSAAQEIADEVLNRNLAGGGSGNTRNVRNALRSLRNRQAIAGGTLTVYEEDDSTGAWTAAVTTTAGNPLSEVDPA